MQYDDDLETLIAAGIDVPTAMAVTEISDSEPTHIPVWMKIGALILVTLGLWRFLLL
jgi:hypothetical protein